MVEVTDTAWSRVVAVAACFVLLTCNLSTAITAQDCPQGPVAVADSAIYKGWNPVAVDVLANDLEEDGEAVEVELMGSTCDVTASVEHGLLLLDFAPTARADCVVSYRLRDASDEVSATVDVAVDVAIIRVFDDTFVSGDTSA